MSHKKFSSAQGAQGKTGPRDKSRDAPIAVTEIPDGRDARQKTTESITESRREETDHQAIERGENEGMIVHQSVGSHVHNRGEHPNAITEQ